MISEYQVAMTRADFQRISDVSCETMEKLDFLLASLKERQKTINLVGRSTLPDVWRRHILDSAQVLDLVPSGCSTITDLGSGAGFPGLVLAIMGDFKVHLVESTGKKATFLSEVSTELGLNTRVHQGRIEALEPWTSQIVTARALAPLDLLLKYASRFAVQSGGKPPVCLFLKGKRYGEELEHAASSWNFDYDVRRSVTDSEGVILTIKKFIKNGR